MTWKRGIVAEPDRHSPMGTAGQSDISHVGERSPLPGSYSPIKIDPYLPLNFGQSLQIFAQPTNSTTRLVLVANCITADSQIIYLKNNAMDIHYLHWLLLIDVASILLFKHYLGSSHIATADANRSGTRPRSTQGRSP
jgi:hypothetical protein